MLISENLKRLRIAAGLTQVAAAKSLGIDQTAISQWESGYTSPRIEKLPLIANLYNCEIADLLSDDPGPTPTEEAV